MAPVSGSIAAGHSGYVVVQVDISNLPDGGYAYAFDIVDPTALNSPLRVNISLQVTGPVLEMSADTFDFPFDEANFNTKQTLTLYNTGGGVLNWTISDPNQPELTLPAWLYVAPVSGTLSHNESDDVTLTVDINRHSYYLRTVLRIIAVNLKESRMFPPR